MSALRRGSRVDRTMRSWRGIVSITSVVLLVGWFMITTRKLINDGVVPETTDVAVWTALVVVQMMIWGFVAYINLGIYSSLRSQAGSGWNAAGFVFAVFFAVALPLGVASTLFAAELLGSFESSYVGAVLQSAGFLSVIPAILVLHAVRTICVHGSREVDAEAVRLIRTLRGAIRPAVASLGVTIAIAIISSNFAREAIAEVSDTFMIESQHVLLYGGFFTGVVFALYMYANSAVDATARQMADEALPVVDFNPADTFFAREEARGKLQDALGLGVNPRETFQSLVVIATPLLGAILTTFVAN